MQVRVRVFPGPPVGPQLLRDSSLRLGTTLEIHFGCPVIRSYQSLQLKQQLSHGILQTLPEPEKGKGACRAHGRPARKAARAQGQERSAGSSRSARPGRDAMTAAATSFRWPYSAAGRRTYEATGLRRGSGAKTLHQNAPSGDSATCCLGGAFASPTWFPETTFHKRVIPQR